MKPTSDETDHPRAGCTSMETGTKADWEIIMPQYAAHGRALPDRILEPFVSEVNPWMVLHHGIFQGYHFFHHIGMDRDMREQFRDHPCFPRTGEFYARYDGPAFDSGAETLPLEFFEPMLRRVFAQPGNSMYKNALE